MKYLLSVVLICTLGSAELADAKVTSLSQEFVVLQSRDLPELAQSAGQSMTLQRFSNGNTYLYLEQRTGARLAIFDVTDPAHVKSVGTVDLQRSSAFDFVRNLSDSTALICFRDNKGAAIVDFQKAKQPKIVVVDALKQAARAELIGNTGLLMAAQPRRDGDVPPLDYQVVDTSDPRSPRLLTTIVQVQQKLYDLTTGATYLLGASGLTVIRQPRVEERHRLEAAAN